MRHQKIAMIPWNLILGRFSRTVSPHAGLMFASPNFTSMGWFVLRSKIIPNRLSAMVAGTQYLSSSMSAFWWLCGEKWPGYNWLILFGTTVVSYALALIWLKGAITRVRFFNLNIKFSRKELKIH